MRIKSRIVPLLLAGIVALGVATVPVAAADAAVSSTQAKAKTGTLAIQLVDVKGKALKKRVTVLYGTTNDLLGDGRTSAKGTISFKKLKPGTRYIAVGGFEGTYVGAVKTKI